MTAPLLIHTFTRAEQGAFAQLSGDGNAIHLDPLRARRELFGRNILHGLHGALRALDAYLAARTGTSPIHLTRIKARFNAPVFLNEPIRVVLVRRDEGSVLLELRNSEQVLYDIEATFAAGAPAQDRTSLPSPAPTSPPQDRAFSDLANRRGDVPLGIDAAAFRGAFPQVAAVTTVAQQAACLGVTRLVGLECPGQQSLLSLFDLTPANDAPAATLAYEVETADARFSLVRMRVRGGGIEGKVEAFYRPLPVDQPSYSAAAQHVSPGSMAGVRALVVGGSRGLGESAAKLLAAAGADVVLTYYKLRQDAVRVTEEIRAGGGAARFVQWNALDPERSAQWLGRTASPTHVLYCATPRMTPRRQPLFSTLAFRAMTSLYVDGLLRTYRACRALNDGPLTLFFPSVEWVEQPGRGTAESAAAKAAGEAACRSLALADRKLRVVAPRFPRLLTDQSQSLTAQPAAAPLSVLSVVLEEFVGVGEGL